MRISKRKDLPNWFNLENYTSFNSMTDEELFYQLSARWEAHVYSLFSELEDIENTIGSGVIVDAKMRSQLVHGDLSGGNEAFGMLPKDGGIEPISINEHYRIHVDVEEYARNKGLSLTSKTLDKYLFHPKSVSTLTNDEYKNNMYAKIDLDWPDELILKNMRNLLPLWREKLNAAPVIDHHGYGWDSVKKKIMDYSLFPLIDLIIWEGKTGNKITNGVLAVSVYPEGDYDATNITQTIKPNLEKIFNFYSIEKCRHELLDRKLLPKKLIEE
ncbi:TPA: DUF6387 family protein [Yersinia enterocolitica]|nr:hypothetical protein [Yersinia enterocolitica]HEB0974915.1 hypothetical protein [Yersinia enterocolitica]